MSSFREVFPNSGRERDGSFISHELLSFSSINTTAIVLRERERELLLVHLRALGIDSVS